MDVMSILKTFIVIAASSLMMTSVTQARIDDKDTSTQPEIDTAYTFGFRQLKGEEIMAAYVNKTMEGVYASYPEMIEAGIPPETFTETHHDNATSTYIHRGARSFETIGVYTVQKDRLCYTYSQPKAIAGQYCFYVFVQESCYFHYSAMLPPPRLIEDFENWTSMAYAKEDAGTCLPSIA